VLGPSHSVLLASSHDFPAWAGALGVPVWLGGLAFVLWLWLGGKVTRTSDCDARVVALQAAHDAELAEARLKADVLQERVDALVVDRDAWREAHREETRARQAAEKAAAALMETGQISLALLSALKDALAGRPNPG
jgi:hypothetical protein